MSSQWRIALTVGMLFMITACGKKGALIYPDMLTPAAPSVATAIQSGAAVKLQLTLPDKDRGGRTIRGLAGVKISRRAADAKQANVCPACTTDYQFFRTVYLDHVPPDTQRFGNSLILIDSDVNVGNMYAYSVTAFTADDVDGSSTLIADVRITAPLSSPLLKIESLPTEVKLHVTSTSQKSGRLIGYNVYRSTGSDSRSYRPLNKEPLKDGEYVDVGLERGVKYRYVARTLIVRPAGDIVESTESHEGEGMLKEDE